MNNDGFREIKPKLEQALGRTPTNKEWYEAWFNEWVMGLEFIAPEYPKTVEGEWISEEDNRS